MLQKYKDVGDCAHTFYVMSLVQNRSFYSNMVSELIADVAKVLLMSILCHSLSFPTDASGR